MEFIMQPYGVYVQVDDQSRIVTVNSDAFIPSLDSWLKIDEGMSDRYHHAQGNYFDKPIYDERGIKRYMIAPVEDWPEREIVQQFVHEEDEYGVYERTEVEMDADYVTPIPQPSPDARITAIEETLAAYEAAYTEGVNEA